MRSEKVLTLGKLMKELLALKASGVSDRVQVCVDKESLFDGNKTFTICNVHTAKRTHINECDGDGFTIINKDGSERTRHVVLLQGNAT